MNTTKTKKMKTYLPKKWKIKSAMKLLSIIITVLFMHENSFGQCTLDISCPADPFEITVQCVDDIPSPATTELELEALGFTINNYCGVLKISSNDISDGNTCPETINRTYTILDDLNANGTKDIGEEEISCEQTIIVSDNTAPLLNIPGNADIACDDDNTPAGTGSATATDNCDSNPTVTFSDATTENNLKNSAVFVFEMNETSGSAISDTTDNELDGTLYNALAYR